MTGMPLHRNNEPRMGLVSPSSCHYFARMQAVLTSEAFAFIPESIRRKLKLKLKPGSVLDFDEDAPFLKAVPAFDIADMMACIGVGKDGYQGKTSDEWLDESRGAVQLPDEK